MERYFVAIYSTSFIFAEQETSVFYTSLYNVGQVTLQTPQPCLNPFTAYHLSDTTYILGTLYEITKGEGEAVCRSTPLSHQTPLF